MADAAYSITAPSGSQITTLPGRRALRLYEIVGDCMEPSLRGGDALMVSDTPNFLYEATYLLDFGDGEAPFIVSRSAGGFAVHHPNPIYSTWSLSREQLALCIRAIIVAEVRVVDHGLLRRAA